MGEDEDRTVEGRLRAPPSVPGWVDGPRPRTAAEHPAPHHLGADIGFRPFDHRAAGIDLSPLAAVRPAPSGELEGPLVQPLALLTQRLLFALVRPGDEAVERDGDPEAELGHAPSLGLGDGPGVAGAEQRVDVG